MLLFRTFILFFMVLSIQVNKAQNLFDGINYQSILTIEDGEDLLYSDITKVYFELSTEKDFIYGEEFYLNNFNGKIDTVFSVNLYFKNEIRNILKQNFNTLFYLDVYLDVRGSKTFVQRQELNSVLFSNISLHNLISPLVVDLGDVTVSSLLNNQLLSWSGDKWINLNDTITDYSVLTGPNTYSIVNKSSFSYESNNSNYSDTVNYADTILYDLNLFGNINDPQVGTTDDKELLMKVNNIERAKILNDGRISLNQYSSDADISIIGNKGFLLQNTFGVGNYPTITNNAVNFWTPKYSSLRMGSYDPAYLLEEVIEPFSFAFGRNVRVSGYKSSVAFGEECVIDSLDPRDFGYDPNDPLVPPRFEEFTSGSNSFTVGYQTEASGSYSFSSGYQSKARFWRSVAMGYKCEVDGVAAASLALGYQCKVTDGARGTADCAAIGYNVSVDSQQSFLIGSNISTNGYWNVFLYGDNSTTNVTSNTSDDQFMVRAAGGVVFYSSSDLSTGVTLPSGSGSWSTLSDKNSKQYLKRVDKNKYLSEINNIPVYSWRYKSSTEDNHIGPIAQDIYKKYSLGHSEKYLSMVDMDGLSFFMMKELNKIYTDLSKKSDKLHQDKQQFSEINFNDISDRISLLEKLVDEDEKK